MLKLCVHMDNELLYCGIENQVLALILPFICSFFCLLSLNLCHSFLRNSQARMSECIVGLRLRVMAFIFLFLSIFLSFPILHVNIKKFYAGVFSRTFKAKMLKLGILMDNELLYCGIENQSPCSYSSLYLSIFSVF